MIIVIIILAVLSSFVSWMMIPKVKIRRVVGTVSLLILAGSIFMLTDQFVNHRGMGTETSQETYPIYSAIAHDTSSNILICKPIGTESKNYAFMYRKSESESQPELHFQPDKSNPLEAIKQNATYEVADIPQASVTINTEKRIWTSSFYRFLFGFGGEDGDIVKQHAVVTIPKTGWQVLSIDEAEKQFGIKIA